MYVQFVTDCKTALSGLWESVENIHKQQAANAARYLPDVADAENKRLDERTKAICAECKKKIASICDKATEDAAALDTISPLTLDTPADQRVLTLLNGQFDLSVGQLQHVVDEYVGKTDNTLLNAVGVYCQNHGMKLNRATAESRRSGIKTIRESALGLISRIEATSYKNQGRDISVPLLVNDFCVDGDFAAATGIYDKIGQKYSGELVPARVEMGDGAFNFHFQRVRDSEAKAG